MRNSSDSFVLDSQRISRHPSARRRLDVVPVCLPSSSRSYTTEATPPSLVAPPPRSSSCNLLTSTQASPHLHKTATMVHTVATLASLIVAASMLSIAEAHTNMMAPAPKWPEGFYNINSPFGRIDSTKFGGEAAGMPGHQGVKKIAAAMGSGTLRDFISKNVKVTLEGANKECGKTLMNGPGVPVPDEIDFPWGHPGPCEAWCDNTKIFFNGDCQGNGVGKIKVDKSKCSGAKQLQVMYAGVHVENYEIYSNCVPLGAGGGAAAPAGGNSNTDGDNNSNSNDNGQNNGGNNNDNGKNNGGNTNNTNNNTNNNGQNNGGNNNNTNNNGQNNGGNNNNNNNNGQNNGGNNNNNNNNNNTNNNGQNNHGNSNNNNNNNNGQGNRGNNGQNNGGNRGNNNQNNGQGNHGNNGKNNGNNGNGNRSYDFGSINNNNNGGNNYWGRGNRQLRA